jgi:hypothetical protein
VKIELLYTPGCQEWADARDELKAATRTIVVSFGRRRFCVCSGTEPRMPVGMIGFMTYDAG